ncbi:hypothetical protein DFH08DRAFT_949453 [Mycena albidolilacea]|uniref:Hydrophobin n=1 Tax=Mycena albidolilacea TaxID=1033008 RepID=A0AAD7F2T2_9AGAR|nr:hypothetical protein DFH08DRAFT_949453 [Mycena albidolilacea]
MVRFLGILLLVLCATSLAASATVRETNGQRMAKGLPPLAPRWMPPTRTQIHDTAKRPSPSPSPSSSDGAVFCRAESVPLCCTAAVHATDPTVAFLLKLLGATPYSYPGLVAITCSRSSNRACTRQAVCCEQDDFDGVIATGGLVELFIWIRTFGLAKWGLGALDCDSATILG